MKVSEHERRDWVIIVVIILIGFMCVFLVGYWAVRFPPSWELSADMGSKLDPNSDFLTRRPGGFVEPVDSIILTQPAWINVILTPGALFPTRIPYATATSALFLTPTRIASATHTGVFPASATHTSTLVYFPPTRTATSYPANTRTPIFTSAPTNISTVTYTSTSTPTNVSTPTSSSTPTAITNTSTATSTSTSTPTATNTPIDTDPRPEQIGTTPDGTVYSLTEGAALTLNINLIADGDTAWDLVYYELPAGSGVRLDWVIIEISDGMNWYTIFNWGDNSADANTNMDFNLLPDPIMPPFPPPDEPDEREIPPDRLYPSPTGMQTGIAIDLDGIVPTGTYRFIRFYAPPGDADGQLEIDAFAVLP